MSPIQLPPLPLDTAQAAESLFGRDHPYLCLGQALQGVWSRLDLSTLESADRALADSFHPYALATLLQYWEGLTDRRMAQATAARLDLKYAMHLPLRLPGLNPEALCVFRQHLLVDETGRNTLQALLHGLGGFGNPGKQIRNVKELVGSVCLRSRAEIVLETMHVALEALAAWDPVWLRANVQPHWYRRYEQGSDRRPIPRDRREVQKLVQAVGRDGEKLLQAIQRSGQSNLAQLPEIRALRREWRSQFEHRQDALVLREPCTLNCQLTYELPTE